MADGWLIAGDPVCYLSCTEKLLATGHVSGPGSSWYRRRPWNSFQLDSLQIAMSVSPNIKTWNSKLRMSGLEVRTMMRTLPSHLWPERTEIQWTMSQLFQIPRYCLVLFHLYFNTDLFLNAVQNLIQIVPTFYGSLYSLQWSESDMLSVTWIWEFWSFPRLEISITKLSCPVGWQHWATALSPPAKELLADTVKCAVCWAILSDRICYDLMWNIPHRPMCLKT